MNMIYALIENSKIHLDEAITMVGISKSYKSGTLNTSSPEDVIDAGGGTINNLPQIYETINVKAAMQNGHTGINVKVGRYFVSYSYFTSQYKPPKDGPVPLM